MKKDDTVYLRHILDATALIEEYTDGMSENEFRVSHPDLPWGKMTGIRNKIIHEYFNVNFAIVWDTVQDDLPALKKTIVSILE